VTMAGLLHPFRRDLKRDFASGDGETLIRNAVAQILGTRQGELAWRTDFSGDLEPLRNQRNDDVLQELARVYVVNALRRWEPRVHVTSVLATREQHDGENVLAIRVRYEIVAPETPAAGKTIEQVILG